MDADRIAARGIAAQQIDVTDETGPIQPVDPHLRIHQSLIAGHGRDLWIAELFERHTVEKQLGQAGHRISEIGGLLIDVERSGYARQQAAKLVTGLRGHGQNAGKRAVVLVAADSQRQCGVDGAAKERGGVGDRIGDRPKRRPGIARIGGEFGKGRRRIQINLQKRLVALQVACIGPGEIDGAEVKLSQRRPGIARPQCDISVDLASDLVPAVDFAPCIQRKLVIHEDER